MFVQMVDLIEANSKFHRTPKSEPVNPCRIAKTEKFSTGLCFPLSVNLQLVETSIYSKLSIRFPPYV